MVQDSHSQQKRRPISARDPPSRFRTKLSGPAPLTTADWRRRPETPATSSHGKSMKEIIDHAFNGSRHAALPRTRTRSDLAEAACKACPHISRADAKKLVNEIFAEVQSGLMLNGVVTLQNFGKFRVIAAKPRLGRNPRNGEPAPIPAQLSVRFRPCPAFRKTVAGG